ncbi:MAG: hypothetical protein DBP02_19820 [gamma proteobacterium symbiont of Ctena orbiculata]|nr:MAG: hypothetical protein DBP02_19820 [gamma proteobacterium symbiont of Ctena orbiculata]
MKAPMIYNLLDLNGPHNSMAEINGKWVPARPLGFFSIWHRFECAWLAFTGQVDLVRWPEGQ